MIELFLESLEIWLTRYLLNCVTWSLLEALGDGFILLIRMMKRWRTDWIEWLDEVWVAVTFRVGGGCNFVYPYSLRSLSCLMKKVVLVLIVETGDEHFWIMEKYYLISEWHIKVVSFDSEFHQTTILINKDNFRDMALYHKVFMGREFQFGIAQVNFIHSW